MDKEKLSKQFYKKSYSELTEQQQQWIDKKYKDEYITKPQLNTWLNESPTGSIIYETPNSNGRKLVSAIGDLLSPIINFLPGLYGALSAPIGIINDNQNKNAVTSGTVNAVGDLLQWQADRPENITVPARTKTVGRAWKRKKSIPQHSYSTGSKYFKPLGKVLGKVAPLLMAVDAPYIVDDIESFRDLIKPGTGIHPEQDPYEWLMEQFKTGGQFKFPKSKALRTEEEMHKRDLRKNLVNNSRPDYIKKARIPNRIKKGENGLKFNEFKAVQPTNRFTYESNITNPDLKINTDQYSDFANYKSIDQIQQELKQKRETAVQVPEIDYSSMSLEQLIKQENLPIKITSGYRANSKTKSGNTSHHSRKDSYGNPMAYDIVPMFNGKVNTTQQGFELLSSSIINNPVAVQWFKDHNFGLLDETSKEMMQRTGATGKHFHIGPDKIAISNWNKLTNNGG